MKHWMFKCSEISKLVSESMDHSLPFWQRLGISLHLKMCQHCSHYKQQLQSLQDAMHRYGHLLQEEEPLATLSEEAKRRIKQNLKESVPSST